MGFRGGTAIGVCDDNSTVNLTSDVTWSSGDESIVTVDAAGTVTCLYGGTTGTVRATYGNIVAEAAYGCVSTDPFVEVRPKQATTTPGETIRFEAWAVDACGEFEWTDILVWYSSDPDVARIDGPGIALGVSEGTVTISTSWGLYGSPATLAVAPASTQSVFEPTSPTDPDPEGPESESHDLTCERRGSLAGVREGADAGRR